MPGKFKILVAEDDAGVRDLIRTRLGLAGYDVHTAKTGTEAIRRISELRPQALVLDINMPELDGFGVLQAIKTHWKGARIPVLILTARHATDDIMRAMSLGAKDYLTKPFTESQLLARVARLLRSPGAAQASRDVLL